MTDRLAMDIPAPAARRPRRAKDPRKRALAAYAAGDLDATAAALDEADASAVAEHPQAPKPGDDYSALSDYLTWLHAEVPAWIDKAADLPAEGLVDEAARCADTIASGADAMFNPDRARPRRPSAKYPTPEPEPHEIRQAVAEGIGILARRPGGVTFSGQHWCTEHHEGCPGTWDVRHKDLHRVRFGGDERGAKGAFFTPRHLAEEVVEGTLSAQVYEPGPLQTADLDAWQLKDSAQILALTTADIAVGAGVFLLASARYLADRTQEAWLGEHDPRAADRGEALRLVIGGCLYGVDISPWSTELTKLTLSLLVPHATVPELGRHIVQGDSLVGVSSLNQVRWMHPRTDMGRELHDVPNPYTAIVGEFIDVAERVMREPRPDLTHPHVWSLLGALCDLATLSLFSNNPVVVGVVNHKVAMLRAARLAHEVLTADQAWRGAVWPPVPDPPSTG